MSSTLVPAAVPDLLGFLTRERDNELPVDEFSRTWDDLSPGDRVEPFRKLMPTTTPGVGQQYAFDVDLDRCTGCKSCVVACHTLNGLDDDESFRKVGLLHGTNEESPFMQSVTTACHHCVDPACLEGCPVDAYEKDDITGIVKHLDDQCIGCQYCVLKCPYEVPRYNERMGIVRKCDMCSQRLAVGESPACVQSCPTEAIRIVIVDTAEVRAQTAVAAASSDFGAHSSPSSNTALGYESAKTSALVPGAPLSTVSTPTTRYHAAKRLPSGVVAADISSDKPAHNHRPLVWFLTLSQLAFGVTATCFAAVLAGLVGPLDPLIRSALTAAAVAGVVSLVASTTHLGQPLRAWRVVLGIGHSWLSREVVSIGAFVGILVSAAGISWAPTLGLFGSDLASELLRVVIPLTFVAGALGVFTSAMLYIDTKKNLWTAPRTSSRFAATSILLGCGATLAVSVLTASLSPSSLLFVSLAAGTLLGGLVSLVTDLEVIRHDREDWSNPLAGPARVIKSSLRIQWILRSALLLVGAVGLPWVLMAASRTATSGAAPLVLASALLLSTFAAELIGRGIFFQAAVSRRMPGARR